MKTQLLWLWLTLPSIMQQGLTTISLILLFVSSWIAIDARILRGKKAKIGHLFEFPFTNATTIARLWHNGDSVAIVRDRKITACAKEIFGDRLSLFDGKLIINEVKKGDEGLYIYSRGNNPAAFDWEVIYTSP